MRKLTPYISALAVAALLFTACGGESGSDSTTSSSASDGSGSDSAAITIEDFAFSGPSSVSAGTTVTATNQDGVTHTWTSDDDVWDSGGLANGESFEFTFEEPGEYPFFCEIHPTMEGTITVEG